MRPIDLMDLCCGRARQFQGWYILLILSPWTTEMDYPKLPTLKKKDNQSLAVLIDGMLPS